MSGERRAGSGTASADTHGQTPCRVAGWLHDSLTSRARPTHLVLQPLTRFGSSQLRRRWHPVYTAPEQAAAARGAFRIVRRLRGSDATGLEDRKSLTRPLAPDDTVGIGHDSCTVLLRVGSSLLVAVVSV
jgi:hypothetical protein